MTKRKDDVARLAGVPTDQVEPVTAVDVRRALAGKLAPTALIVATSEPANYWKVGDRYFLDDPYFGDVCDMADLDYNSDIGLHVKRGDS